MMSPLTIAHHRWADLPPDHPMALIERRRVIGRQAMVSHVELKKGCVVPTHAHFNEQITCVLRGRLRMGIGPEASPSRRTIEVGTGEVLHLPGDTPHSAEALEDTLVLDVFSPPSEKTGIDARG
jgi:quercetin dioxygenase-like cupin family protein